jgi:hypothetical protein
MTMQLVALPCHCRNFIKRGLTHFYASTFAVICFQDKTRHGTVCVPLGHEYGAWENKEKVHNGGHNDSDSEAKDCMSR